MLHAVVMAGGAGTRFWPLSRVARPKQLLALMTPRTLLEETVKRISGLVPEARVHIITNDMHAVAIRRLLPAVPALQVVAEPCSRDTAPCIALAAALIGDEDPDAVLAVLPADHVVEPAARLREALAHAEEIIRSHPESLLTFGIRPTRPATGFGYIERGRELGAAGDIPCFHVTSFREKPDAASAARYLQAGKFFWNAGIFVFRAQTIRARIERYLPELAAALGPIAAAARKGAIPMRLYRSLPSLSIDYGVFEKDGNVVVLEAPFKWDDVGSFTALERVLPGDAAGNRVLGELSFLEARNNIVIAGAGHRIALIGVHDLVVVHTDDVTLVCAKQDAERVKEMVARLKKDGEDALL